MKRTRKRGGIWKVEKKTVENFTEKVVCEKAFEEPKKNKQTLKFRKWSVPFSNNILDQVMNSCEGISPSEIYSATLMRFGFCDVAHADSLVKHNKDIISLWSQLMFFPGFLQMVRVGPNSTHVLHRKFLKRRLSKLNSENSGARTEHGYRQL